MNTRMKKWLAILLGSVLLLFSFSGCADRADSFTLEEHIQRISERIKVSEADWGYPEGESYENFTVYPLYNENEEFTRFLVEFEPYGFVFVRVRDLSLSDRIGLILSGQSTSMYARSHIYNKDGIVWSPYKAKGLKSIPENIEWILDENGERIYYYKSPYYVTNNINERKYLIDLDNAVEYICAVKKDGEFINLISGEKVDILVDKYTLYRYQATLHITSHGRAHEF